MEYFFAAPRPADGLQDPQRRRLLAAALPAAAAIPVLGSQPAMAQVSEQRSGQNVRNGSRIESTIFSYADPVEHQRQSYRILRNTHAEADVLFWYHFTMFSVPVGKAPQAVVRWEGIEFSHHRRLAENIYRIHGHNLSFPRDLRSGQWTDIALNPVTGESVNVPPMALTGDPGYVYTPAGVIPLDDPEADPRVRIEQFLLEDDLIKIEQVRLPPASWPATFVETSSNWSSRDLFENTDLPSLPAGTAGGYVFPWPKWMGMGDAPGHMFATWHGRKLGSVSDLPEEFLERAARSHEDLLKINMNVFDEPLPVQLASRLAIPR
ncbi:MAG: hypothetical protein AB8B57_16105 [Congregibacter sp.]